jgi:hypothetical protein
LIKKILLLVLLLCLSIPAFSEEETNWKDEYTKLLAEYELTVNSLEETRNDYSKLLISYDTLIEDYDNLFDLYTKKQLVLDKTAEQLTADEALAKQMEDTISTLTKLVDPKYFTLFVQGGMVGKSGTGDIGIIIDIPRIPISLITSANYTLDVGFGAKIGLGVQF